MIAVSNAKRGARSCMVERSLVAPLGGRDPLGAVGPLGGRGGCPTW